MMTNNKMVIKQILEMVNTLTEASLYLKELYYEHKYYDFNIIYMDMVDSLNNISNEMLKMNEIKGSNIELICDSVIDSLKKILLYFTSRSFAVCNKIEFELIPLLKELYVEIYYWKCIYPDERKILNYYKNELVALNANNYIDEAERIGQYKYDISIIVIGYNKLKYTKICIEHLLQYVPEDLRYELILVNHGSSDGTKEYFQSIAPSKQLNILKNGGGLPSLSRIVEGKYSLVISNDVIITEKAITNMLKCISSDDRIAWVVPTTPNVSNLQSIYADYRNIEEMHKFATKNNVTNKYRWEQRVRLCNPVTLTNNKICYSSKGVLYGKYNLTPTSYFPDDKACLLLRRNGYKLMLAKDAYCYHFGSVTMKSDTTTYKDKQGNKGKQAFYLKGRKEFLKAFGVDPWGTGFCWEPELFKKLPCNEKEAINVLGINCGFGSNPLKVKESIKENVHNLKVKIYNITDEHCYIQDLKGVSDIAEYVPSIEDLNSFFSNEKFKYIIIESKFETYENPLKILDKLKNNIVEDGILAIKIQQKELKDVIKLKFNDVIESGQWMILKSF